MCNALTHTSAQMLLELAEVKRCSRRRHSNQEGNRERETTLSPASMKATDQNTTRIKQASSPLAVSLSPLK